LGLVTFLGFFNPSMGGPIAVELVPKSGVVMVGITGSKTSICGCPVIKTGESLLVANPVPVT
jgi:hypothetical protein